MTNRLPILFSLVLFAVSTTLAFAQPTWTWQNPAPTGSDVLSLTFINANTGIAVGSYGAVARTTDAGITWSAMSSGTTATFWHVAFANANDGVAVGDSGVVLHSTDGGLTWYSQHYGTSAFYGISFADASTGVAVGASGAILRTTDGGGSWSFVASGTTKTLLSAGFGDATHGAATGASGTVVHTTDAGATWTVQNILTFNTLNAIAFFDADNAVVAGQAGYVANSTDGGWTWVTWGTNTTVDLHGLQMTSSSDVFICGDRGYLSATHDGGLDWTNMAAAPDDCDVYGFYRINGEALVAVGSAGHLFTSADQGSTWTNRQSGPTADLYDVMYFNSNTGFAAGNGTILSTTDQGKHWTSVPTDTLNSFFGCYAVTSNFGYMTGTYVNSGSFLINSLVMKTTNSGATWSNMMNSSNIIERAAWLDANIGTVVGAILDSTGFDTTHPFLSYIGRTTNGGVSWTSQNTNGANELLRDVAFGDANTGVCVGDAGTIMRTVNGGTTWTAVTGLTSADMYSACFPNATTVIIAGSGGTMFRSTNAGQTWTSVSTGTTNTFSMMRFTSQYVGIAVGAGGIFMRTTSGGATWNTLRCPTTNTILGVVPQDSVNATIVGFSGIILRWHGNNLNDTIVPTKPVFAAAPSVLNFDSIYVNTNRSMAVIVHNTTRDSLIITAIASDNALFTVKSATGKLGPGDSMAVNVKFTATSTGVKTGNLVFSDNTAAGHDTIPMRGVGMNHAVSFSLASLDCGSAHVGSTSTATFSLTNTSGAPLTISSIETDNTVFVITPQTFTLNSGDSMEITVKFTPVLSGTVIGHFTVHHNGFQHQDNINASGLGRQGQLVISKSSLTFGDVPLFLTRTLTIIVTNSGNAPVAISSAKINNNHFTVTPDTATIEVNGGVIFTVKFMALDTVAQNEWLVFTHTESGPDDSVQVTGRGVVVDLLLSTDFLNFRKVDQNSTRTLTFTMYNRSAKPIGISNIQSTDPHFTPNPATKNLLAGDSANVDVTFISPDLTAYSAWLIITSDLITSPDSIQLLAFSVTDVAQGSSPNGFALAQNYPNPFTDVTNINFTLPTAGHVVITLTDVLGDERATIAAQKFNAGPHTIPFNAAALPAGVYYVHITAAGQTSTRMLQIVR